MSAMRSKKAATKEKISRASVSFPVEHYEELERIAESNKVSVAWVVRQAVEKYLVDRYPLLSDRKES
jgi:metal-responsive CopG/Arc/MetJ family transcriptional regulator